MLLVNGCRTLEVLSTEVDVAASEACAFEAESGRFSKGGPSQAKRVIRG